MTTLDYQSGDDVKPQQWRQLPLKLFGPSREDVWKTLAHETGAEFKKGGFWKGSRVVASRSDVFYRALAAALASTAGLA